MKIEALEIADVKVLTPGKFGDARGFFSETWNKKVLADLGLEADFVQDNHAFTAAKGTVRALHFQRPPMAQDKLVRVVRGSILDVAVDLRKNSPAFGRHVKAVISAGNWQQIWVPKGFAHGYVTLEPDTEVIYKVTEFYSPVHDAGIQWDDPALGIDWGVTRADAILSDKDTKLPPLAQAENPF